MSAILKQMEMLKEAAEATAEWNDMVSVEDISERTHKTIQAVKDLLNEKGLKPVGKLGKTYFYSKREFIKAIKITA